MRAQVSVPKLHVLAAAGGKVDLHDEPLPYQVENFEAMRRKDKH